MLQYAVQVFLERKSNQCRHSYIGRISNQECRSSNLKVFQLLTTPLGVFLIRKTLKVNKIHKIEDLHSKTSCISVMGQTPNKLKYLVLLPTLPLLFYLLLLFKLFCHASLSQGLALAPFVGFGVQGCLQGRVTAHAGHHLLP